MNDIPKLIEIAGGWKQVIDVFTDARLEPEPQLVHNVSGVNMTVGLLNNITALECLQKFITIEVIKHIVSCVSVKASNILTFLSLYL